MRPAQIDDNRQNRFARNPQLNDYPQLQENQRIMVADVQPTSVSPADGSERVRVAFVRANDTRDADTGFALPVLTQTTPSRNESTNYVTMSATSYAWLLDRSNRDGDLPVFDAHVKVTADGQFIDPVSVQSSLQPLSLDRHKVVTKAARDTALATLDTETHADMVKAVQQDVVGSLPQSALVADDLERRKLLLQNTELNRVTDTVNGLTFIHEIGADSFNQTRITGRANTMNRMLDDFGFRDGQHAAHGDIHVKGERIGSLLDGSLRDPVDDTTTVWGGAAVFLYDEARGVTRTAGDYGFQPETLSELADRKLEAKDMRQGLSRVHIAHAEKLNGETGSDPAYAVMLAHANDYDKRWSVIEDQQHKASPLIMQYYGLSSAGKAELYKHRVYSESEYLRMMDVANTDGDKPVFLADMSYDGRVNADSLMRPEKPFDRDKHVKHTFDQRDVDDRKSLLADSAYDAPDRDDPLSY